MGGGAQGKESVNIFFKNKKKYIYLKAKVRERGKERPSIHWFTIQMATTIRGKPAARASSGSPMRVEKPKH